MNIYKLRNQFGYTTTSIIRFACHNTTFNKSLEKKHYSNDLLKITQKNNSKIIHLYKYKPLISYRRFEKYRGILLL